MILKKTPSPCHTEPRLALPLRVVTPKQAFASQGVLFHPLTPLQSYRDAFDLLLKRDIDDKAFVNCLCGCCQAFQIECDQCGQSKHLPRRYT